MSVSRDHLLRDAEDGGGIRIDTEESLTSPDAPLMVAATASDGDEACEERLGRVATYAVAA